MPPLRPEQWKEVNPYLDQALSLPEEERAAWLAAFRESHPPLADLLQSLLHEHSALAQDQFLERDLTEPSPVPGAQLGPYQIEVLLGAGGMGEVYRARDTRLDRTVAIKVLPRRFMSDPERRQRFEREARAISALQHPNICTLYDVGRHDNTDYLVMEYLEGQTLKDWIEGTESQPAPERLAKLLDFAIQICRGLEAAHQKGTLHRDIKPANIFVTESGEAKILDFGLAKSLGMAEAATERAGVAMETLPATNVVTTRTGAAIGTPSYLSPEQVRGDQLDARSDLFSFGLVLYEMATRQRAFQGDTTDALGKAVLNTRTPPIRKLNPQVPVELERIVGKALEKDRDLRYQSAAELRADLERLQKPRTWGWRGAVAVIVALLVFGAGAYRWLRPKQIPFQKTAMTHLTTRGKVRIVAISPDGTEEAYSVDESGEGDVTSSGADDKESLWLLKESSDLQLIATQAGRYGALTFTRDGRFLYFIRSDIRNDSAYSINRIPVEGGTAQRIIADVAPPFDLTFSPDGKQMAFVRETEDQSFLMVANVDGSGVRQLAARRFPAGFELAAWSPSGETIASFGYDTEKGIDSGVPVEIALKDGKERPITSRRWSRFWGMKWTSDGQGLLAMTQEQNAAPAHLSYISRESGDATRLTNELDNFTGASLTADFHTLATVQVYALDDLWVGPLAMPDSINPITFGGHAEESGWNPEGQILYFQPLEKGNEIWAVASDGSNSKKLAVNNAGRDFHLRICPGARKVVFNSERSGQDHIWTMDPDGLNPKQLTNSPYDVNGFPDCSADGKWVYYTKSGPEKGIWKIPIAGGDSVRLTDRGANVPVASPDGKMIAYYFHDDSGNPSKGLAIMSSAGGPPLRKFPIYFQYARLRWTPDGKSLVLIRGQNGVSNLWEQPINGGPPRQITHFNVDQIFGFDLSPDGKQVVMQRGRNTRDVVLIHDIQ